MKKIIIFFILLSLIFPGSAFSKSKTLYWKSLLTEEKFISTENYFNPIEDIEIDPNNSNIIYLATWGKGLLKSNDGGKRFSPSNNGLSELNLHTVKVSSDESKNIYVGSATGLFVSYDSAESFSLLGDLRLNITSIEFGEDTVYAGVSNGSINSGLYAYSGGKWVSVGLEDKDVFSIAGLNSSTLLIGTSDGLYLFDQKLSSFKFLSFQGSTVNKIVVSSRKIVVLTNNGVYESDLDPMYFVNLESIGIKLTEGNFTSASIYKDSPYKVVIGSDDGRLYRVDLEKKTFEQLSIKAEGIYSVNISQEGVVYVGSRNALFWSDNDCKSFKAYTLSFFGADLSGELQIDPKNPEVIYVGTDNGLYKSYNRGMSFLLIGFHSERVFSIAINPDDSSELFVGTNLGLYRSSNVSESFEDLPNFRGYVVTRVVVVPETEVVFASSDRGVFRSKDHGSTWENTLTIRDGDFVLEIAIDPVNSDIMYVATFLNGLYKTYNGGLTWQHLGHEELKFSSISICKTSPNVVYASSIGSVYLSKDGGKTFSKTFNVSSGENTYYNFKQIVVHPNNPNVAFSVGDFIIYGINKFTRLLEKVYDEPFLYMTSNMGKSWTKLDLPNTIESSNAIYYDASTNSSLILTGIGILRYDFNSMRYWFNSQGFPDQYVRVVRFFDDVLFVGTTSGNIGRSYDMGDNFEFYAKFDVPILTLYQDQSDPKTIYAGTSLGVLVSNDFGESWKRYFFGEIYAVAEIIHNGEDVLLLGGDIGILKVDKDLKSYKIMYDGICTALFYKDGVLYAGTDKGLLISKDLENFEVLNNIESKIFCISIFNESIYVGTMSGLYLVKDKDTIPIISDLMILDMAFANGNMYIATDGGVLVLNNDLSYTVINDGLMSYYATSIACSKNGQPFLGTDGGGLYKLEGYFELFTFTINASATAGGSISPSGTITVNYGDSKTFTITPDPGYKIKDVKVDAVSKGSISSYTFTNITSDHTISVTFEKEITQIVIILQIGNTTFTVNGSTRTLDSPPIIKNGRTLLPIRAVVEALGGTVGWDASTKKVTVSLGSITIELWIGKPIAKVNGIDTPIDATNPKVVPEIINGRTMLPLRFVAESLGCDVQWDGTTKTITITYLKP